MLVLDGITPHAADIVNNCFNASIESALETIRYLIFQNDLVTVSVDIMDVYKRRTSRYHST